MGIDSQTKRILKEVIFRFLDQKKAKVFVFGSRAIGKAQKFSDIDIGIKSQVKIDPALISEIKEAFETSDLPYKVDVVDFNNVSRNFRKVALNNLIFLN